MLPRPERLTRSGLFQRTHAGKKSVNAPPVSLYVLERQPKSSPRPPLVGFVIGKKVHARATLRNRAKRRVREAYRLLRQQPAAADPQGQVNLNQWYSLVWHIQIEALEAPFEQLRRSVEQCLMQASQKYGRKPKTKADG